MSHPLTRSHLRLHNSGNGDDCGCTPANRCRASDVTTEVGYPDGGDMRYSGRWTSDDLRMQRPTIARASASRTTVLKWTDKSVTAQEDNQEKAVEEPAADAPATSVFAKSREKFEFAALSEGGIAYLAHLQDEQSNRILLRLKIRWYKRAAPGSDSCHENRTVHRLFNACLLAPGSMTNSVWKHVEAVIDYRWRAVCFAMSIAHMLGLRVQEANGWDVRVWTADRERGEHFNVGSFEEKFAIIERAALFPPSLNAGSAFSKPVSYLAALMTEAGWSDGQTERMMAGIRGQVHACGRKVMYMGMATACEFHMEHEESSPAQEERKEEEEEKEEKEEEGERKEPAGQSKVAAFLAKHRARRELIRANAEQKKADSAAALGSERHVSSEQEGVVSGRTDENDDRKKEKENKKEEEVDIGSKHTITITATTTATATTATTTSSSTNETAAATTVKTPSTTATTTAATAAATITTFTKGGDAMDDWILI